MEHKFFSVLSLAQEHYLAEELLHRRQVRIVRTMLMVLFLALWELAASFSWIDSFIFSSPSMIGKYFYSMLADGSFFVHTGITLMETLVSFLLVILISLACALLLWSSRAMSEILEPYLVVLNSLPKSALAPLLIVWLGANYKTIILTGMSVAIFGTILNLYIGFHEVDEEKIKLIQTLGGNKSQALFKVILPANRANLIGLMKSNIGLCLVGVIIGEFIAAKRGLGYLIIYGSQVFKLDWVILSIFILCIIAMGFYSCIRFLERFIK